MSESPTVKKRDMPLAMLLLAVHVAVNYRSLIGIFTGLSSLGAGGAISLMQYLANVVLALVPVAMLVLVAMCVFQGKAVAKALSALCVLMGVGFLMSFGLALYWNIVLLQMGFYEMYFQFGDFGASLAFAIGMFQIGSKLRKDRLRPQLRSYGLTFYGLLFVVVLFVAIPTFMDMTVTLNVASLLGYALFMAAGFILPATLLEDGKKSPVDVVNLVTTILLAAILYGMGGTVSYSSYSDSHRMPEVTTVSCPVCHKKYTDNGNKRSIQRKNMSESCNIGYKATKDALGW